MANNIVDALTPLIQALEADGYSAEIGEGAGVISFKIVAGPDACVDCLSPRVIMEPTIIHVLRQAGFDQALELSYPSGSGH
jgi:hypothetical protein